MSVSALPEWKQLLLERKRREEEERERREREEEERLASMPAWKRGIIQRRRAKQEGGGERDRDREGEGTQYGFTNRNFDGYCDDQLMLRQTDIETDTTSKETYGQVSVENIGPIRQNPFIRSQNSYKRENRRRDADRENHGKEKETSGEEYMGEKEKDQRGEDNSQSQEREFWRGRDREMRMEKTRDRSEGREKVGIEGMKDRERDVGKVKREGERDGVCLSLSSGLRTFKAENIIIIEKDGKTSEREREQSKKEEREGERLAEQDEKMGMRMDLREILASGGNVTEIRASEVLIIKPSITEEKNREVEQGNERKSSKENVLVVDKGREGRDQDRGMKEAEVWSGSTISLQENLSKQDKSSLGSGRVSEILSKFGQQLKPPCRSKSIDCFIRPGKDNSRVTLTFGPEEEREEDMDAGGFKGVPKRSFSFSEQVVCEDRKVVERAYSDRRHPPPVVIVQSQSVDTNNRKQARVRDDHQLVMQRKREIEGEVEKIEPKLQESRQTDKQGEEVKERGVKGQGSSEANGGEVFSLASVRKPEGIAFARRIPIRQDRKELKKFQENRAVDKRSQKEMDKKMEIDRQKMQREFEKGRQIEFQVEEKAESIKLRRDGEEVTVVMESVKSFCTCTLDSHHWSNSHTVLDHKTESQHPAVRQRKNDATTDYCKAQNQPEHNVLPQHRDERLSKTGTKQEIRDHRDVGPNTESDTSGNKQKAEKSAVWHEQEEHRGMSNAQGYRLALKTDEDEPPAPKSPKHTPWMVGGAQQEFRIPRSVFFGVEEVAEGHKPGLSLEDGQIVGVDLGKGVERRESWKAGRPLTRVESLRERIRQREMERQKRGDVEGEGGRETDRREEEGLEKGGGEKQREAEGAQRAVMVNRQEVALPQTLSLFDVTKEASVSKACPQLPASVPLLLSQSLSAGREAPQLSNNGQRYLEQDEEFRHQQDPDSLTRALGEEGETEDDLLEDKYLCPSHSPSPPSSLSPTPSPPLPHSLAAMSRIYNLKTVGSRTAVCISERNSDVPTHSKKVFPEGRFIPISHSVTQTSVCPQDRATFGSDRTDRRSDGQSVATTETSAVQSVQRHLGQLQLREQEVKQSSPGNEDIQCGPQKETGRKTAEGQKRPDTQKSETPVSSRVSPTQQTGTRIPTKLPQPKSFTINSRNAQSPENIKKTSPSSPSTPSSPSSISLSPSLAPSPSRSSPLFSIRSASGGPGKRGTTITITPRRPAAGNSATPPNPSPTGTPTIPEIPVPVSQPNITDEGRKKRYPTVEEIEVIGGYQNLENSCLIKNRGSPKGVTVRFESQLEQVCEYPSEDSMLASMPAAGEEQEGEEGKPAEGDDNGQEEEEDEEGGAFVSSGAKSVGTSTGTTRVLRVDESCRR